MAALREKAQAKKAGAKAAEAKAIKEAAKTPGNSDEEKAPAKVRRSRKKAEEV
jgi:hypothetical protein